MIEISLDLGNTPSVLAALADPRITDKLVKVGAEVYVDETLDWIDAGKAFKGRTGILEQSIGWNFAGNGTAEVFANAEYAGWVEEGTEPHVIEPRAGRSALKIPSSAGGFFFTGKVDHPGSKPHPFFFADRDNREDKMQAKMISVLESQMGKGHV